MTSLRKVDQWRKSFDPHNKSNSLYTYGMKFGIHSEQYQNNYTKAEEQKFTQVFGELTSEFAAKMFEGVHASDESVQELVKRHYDFILQFWTPNKEAYKSLAMTYILPSPYRDSYEELPKGLVSTITTQCVSGQTRISESFRLTKRHFNSFPSCSSCH